MVRTPSSLPRRACGLVKDAGRACRLSAGRHPIRLALMLLFCVLLAGEGAAAPGDFAQKKGNRPPSGQIRRGGKKKPRRSKPKKPAQKPDKDESESEEAATSQPAEPEDGPESVATVLRRLGRMRRGEMSERDIALKAGLEFVRALCRADGEKASALLEVTGYQVIPGDGLGDEPGPRITPEAFAAALAAGRAAAFETLPAECVEAAPPEALREKFPGISTWMLPTDWGIVLKPVAERNDWVQREACLVVRLRARKPTVQGGTALEPWLGILRAGSGEIGS